MLVAGSRGHVIQAGIEAQFACDVSKNKCSEQPPLPPAIAAPGATTPSQRIPPVTPASCYSARGASLSKGSLFLLLQFSVLSLLAL